MDAMFVVKVVMRWLHVLSAVLALGSVLFLRFVVLPAGPELVDRLKPRIKKVVHASIGILLVTGLYNYLAVAVPRLKETGAPGLLAGYHAVMGVKILLSLAFFAIATLLLVPVRSIDEKRSGWLTVNTVLGLAVLLLAAYLRRIW